MKLTTQFIIFVFALIASSLAGQIATADSSCYLTEDKHLMKEVEVRLNWLFYFLKKHTNVSRFDKDGFRVLETALSLEINSLDTVIGQMPLCKHLSHRSSFASHMLQVMRDSAEYLDKYTGNESDARVMRYVIELNVQLLALRNAYGMPDTQREGYAEDVSAHIRNLHAVRGLFEQLQNVDFAVSIMFYTLFDRALETLKVYAWHLRLPAGSM
ncbi:hypothetical protein OXX79_009852 [Metschnikowia pulcherrima]